MKQFLTTLLVILAIQQTRAQVSGTVFRDLNANGSKENNASFNEVGMKDVTVKAYDASGAEVGSTTSSSTGAYSFTGLTLPLRIEFTNFGSASLHPAANGSNNTSSVQFYTAATSNADFAVNNPAHYSQTNPDLVTPKHLTGDPFAGGSNMSTEAALFRFPNTASGNAQSGGTPTTTLATQADIGSTWGVAYDRARKKLFMASVYRRHAPLGPGETGGRIYFIDNPSSATPGAPAKFIDLVSDLGISVGSIQTNSARGLPGNKFTATEDAGAFSAAGKVGLGDIDISDDGQFLFVVNLFDKKVYKIDIAQVIAGTPNAVALPDFTVPCSNGNSRPWGLGMWDGELYLGVVCDGLTGANADLRMTVQKFNFNSNTWTEVMNVTPDWNKGDIIFGGNKHKWQKWVDDWNSFISPSWPTHPQPIIGDIEFDEEGSMHLAVLDRIGFQTGHRQKRVPDNGSLFTGITGGELLRTYKDPNTGNFSLENNGTCGPYTTAGTGNNSQTGQGGPNTLQGPGDGEFYCDDHTTNAHSETTNGGLAMVKGSRRIASVQMDPIDGQVDASGVLWLNTTNGLETQEYQIFFNAGTPSPDFSKQNGLGDLEFIADSAPIEIGNRVWADTDGNGIQDADEIGISGVTVELYLAGNLVGTTSTDGNGHYYFNSTNVNQNGATQVEANTAYEIRINTLQGNLSTYPNLTTANADASANGDERDSDGTGTSMAVIALTTGRAGENNHSYDFGFSSCIKPDAGADQNTTSGSGITLTGTNPSTGNWIANPGNPAGATLGTTSGGVASVTFGSTASGYYQFIYQTTVGCEDSMVVVVTNCNFTPLVSNVSCHSNGTETSNTDDYMTFLLTPSQDSVMSGKKYTVTATQNGNPVTITLSDNSPATDLYFGYPSPLRSASGTAGQGDILLTITTSNGCSVVQTITVTDPGTCGVITPACSTGTVTYTYRTPFNLTDLNYTPLLIPKFDDAGGTRTLNQVNMNYSMTMATVMTLENSAANPQNATVSATGDGYIDLGSANQFSGNVFTSAFPNISTGSLSYQAGIINPAGVNGSIWPGDSVTSSVPKTVLRSMGLGLDDYLQSIYVDPTQSNTWVTNISGLASSDDDTRAFGGSSQITGSNTYTTIGDLANFQGSGFVDMGASTLTGLTTSGGGGNINTIQRTKAYAEVTVTYSYSTQCCGSVGNYVWSDLNNNGTNDEAPSAGINGVTVELWNATTNTLVSSTTTANDGGGNPGYYNFTVCNSGDYKVKFPTTNGGKNLTTQTTTAATDNNSDPSAVDGFSPTFTINTSGSGTDKDNPTIDAGYQAPKACLGNYVWNDLNQNGIQDGSEVGVSGVTTTLYNANTNTILAIVTTDAYGFYQFCELNPGDYKVGFTLPANYVYTTANNGNDEADGDANPISGLTGTYTLASGDSNMTVDAGIYQPQPTTASVGDRVWFDANNNGLQDPGEQGVSGVTVMLYNCGNLNAPLAATVTDANGLYIFENLQAGSYQVIFSAPLGTVFTNTGATISGANNSDADGSGVTGCFTVAAGDAITYVDAGIVLQNTANSSLGDRVWNDANQNGIQDPNETGVGGVNVDLYDASGTTIIGSTTTDALGNYQFSDLAPGCYVVGFALPAGYTRTTAGAGTDSSKNSDANVGTGMTGQICLSAGQNNPTIDAGIYNASNTNSIGDRVWYDANQNGLQDGPEYGYPGVVVTLYDCTTNTIVATTTTNSNGNYLFDGLANGDYYVGFGFIPGYQFTSANSDAAGVLGANNSDANPSSGLTACVTLSGNTNITTVDAGIYEGNGRTATSSLGDLVWVDANNNGLQDAGEPGVSGVTATLVDANTNTTLASTITDGLGNYIFTNLTGGLYRVEFSNIPAGYTFTTQSGSIEDELNSDANAGTGITSNIPLGLGEDKMSVDAGIVPPASTVCLGDYVWFDLNNNGVQDGNEPQVPGVTVKLYDNNTNTVLQVTTTNRQGKYLFCGLSNGNTYSVGFENLPSGYEFTVSNGALSVSDNSDANPTTGRTTTVTLGSTDDLTLDAGIYSTTTAVVGNYVWYDEDADGIQDPTEAPIPGVLVTLYDNTNIPVSSAVTDANGGYLFTNVTPGNYVIGFSGYPGSLVPTSKGSNASADDDSNIDPNTGLTDVFTVTPGSSNLTLDAGYKANPVAGLGNYVWHDLNENGLQDPTEAPISGVVVTLYASDGTTPLGTAITDGNGAYSFPNLTAGSYIVGFSNLPNGYTRTRIIGVLNDALNSDINANNQTALITLSAGTYNPNIDAGFYMGVPLGARELVATLVKQQGANQAIVNWYTKDEENTATFEIQRSTNGSDYTKVGTKAAGGNTQGQTNYSAIDDISGLEKEAVIYYRIKLIDIDAQQKYSNTISLKLGTTTNDGVLVHPIPFTNRLTVTYVAEMDENITLELLDMSGRVIARSEKLVTKGLNNAVLDNLESLSSSQYLLRIVPSGDGETQVIRVNK